MVFVAEFLEHAHVICFLDSWFCFTMPCHLLPHPHPPPDCPSSAHWPHWHPPPAGAAGGFSHFLCQSCRGCEGTDAWSGCSFWSGFCGTAACLVREPWGIGSARGNLRGGMELSGDGVEMPLCLYPSVLLGTWSSWKHVGYWIGHLGCCLRVAEVLGCGNLFWRLWANCGWIGALAW